MRHRKKSEKFSRSRAQRKALIKSLLRALIINESIQTTESKAKGIRPWIDKLIGWGKDGTLHARRQAYKILNDHQMVSRLFQDIAPRYEEIQGGYTRIMDLGKRKGDGAQISLLEFTRMVKKKVDEKSKKEEGISGKEEAQSGSSLGKASNAKRSFMKGVKSIFKKK